MIYIRLATVYVSCFFRLCEYAPARFLESFLKYKIHPYIVGPISRRTYTYMTELDRCLCLNVLDIDILMERICW